VRFGTILSAGAAGSSLAGGGYLSLVSVIVGLLTSWVSTVVPITDCGQATVSYHVRTPGTWRGTVTAETEVRELISTATSGQSHVAIRWTSNRTEQTSITVTDRLHLGGSDDAHSLGYIRLEGHQYTQGFASRQVDTTVTNASASCGVYDYTETESSGGSWYFDAESGGGITLYPDGRYTIDWYARATDEDVVVPGEKSKQVTVREGDCFDIGSGGMEWSYSPTTTTGSVVTSVSGHIDPENPGNVLAGSEAILNDDLSTTTLTWNLVHDGPIILPNR
jgi:hypothetical protein